MAIIDAFRDWFGLTMDGSLFFGQIQKQQFSANTDFDQKSFAIKSPFHTDINQALKIIFPKKNFSDMRISTNIILYVKRDLKNTQIAVYKQYYIDRCAPHSVRLPEKLFFGENNL